MLTITFTILFLTSFLSSENLIATMVGATATYGITSWIKSKTGLQGLGALLVAVALSFVVAITAYVISTIQSGGQVTWEMIPASMLQIFALATLAYKLLMSDSVSGN